ncbi:MAG: glyceraldehyde-3-phosphate dehydrogenase [Gemmobacter sp.]
MIARRMSDRLGIWLSIGAVAIVAVGVIVTGGEGTLFLARKLDAQIAALAFWR